MISSPRMFLKHEQNRIGRRTLVHLCVSLFLSALGFTVVALQMVTASSSAAASLILGGLIGCVAMALTVSLIYGVRKSQKHDVVITSGGVWYDGQHWPWERVREIRSTRVLPDGAAYIAMSVDRGPTRSFLRLPVQVRGGNPLRTIAELREFLKANGHSIPWSGLTFESNELP